MCWVYITDQSYFFGESHYAIPFLINRAGVNDIFVIHTLPLNLVPE